MRYIVRHHQRDITIQGYPFAVTRLFSTLIDGLRAQHPQHTFAVETDEQQASQGNGGPYSCLHLSIWHPETGRYILVSLFDNWRNHFNRDLGWQADRMAQFFYPAGFDVGDYFRFKHARRAEPSQVFPDDIQSVFRELPYPPYREGLDAEMEALFCWPKRTPATLLFRGWLWEPRKRMLEGLEREDIVIVDTNAGGTRLAPVDYLTEMTEHAAVLSLPGGAAICHRDIEAFAVGVPVIRPHLPSQHADPLVPGVHYISCYHAPDWGDNGVPSFASYVDFQQHLVRTWDRVRHDREYLAFVATQARAWYARHCTTARLVDYLLAEIDLSALEQPDAAAAPRDSGATGYAALLTWQPRDQDVLGVTDWLWVKDDTSAWPGPRLEWIREHDTKYFRHLRGTDTVVTAGANCGLHARMFAQRFARVYAFEPDPLNFHCLVHNCQMDHVVKMMCALGEENRLVRLHRSPLSQCGSHRVNDRVAPSEALVPMITLDSLGLDRCDLLQLDVEGFEGRVLRGARETIRRCRPVIAVETRQGVDAPDVIATLAGHSYVRVDLSGSDSVWVFRE